MSRERVNVGPVAISLPSASSGDFSIFEDLAGLFGVDEQHEAVVMLEGELAALDLRPQPVIDYEADNALITSESASTILAVAQAIVALSKRAPGESGPEVDAGAVLAQLRSWKRPTPQAWDVGDVFSIPLSDGRFSFGQVVGILPEDSTPVCAWFALVKSEPVATEDDLLEAAVVVIVNGTGAELNDGTFSVCANVTVLADPSHAERGMSISEGFLTDFAERWFGLAPWNVLYPGYYEKLLLPGRSLPPTAIMLSEQERNEYRREHFNIDENNQPLG